MEESCTASVRNSYVLFLLLKSPTDPAEPVLAQDKLL